MIALVILGILGLTFAVAVFLASRNLPVGQLLLWIGLFLASITFIFISARVMRIHAVWKDRVANVEVDTEAALKVQDRLQRGPESVIAVSHQLSNETVGGGQVWNNVIVAPGPNGVIADLRVWGLDRCVGALDDGGLLAPIPATEPPVEAAEAPAGDATAAAEGAATEAAPDASAVPAETTAAPPAFKPHGLQVDMQVHAFREVRVDRLPPPVQQFLFRARDSEASGAAGEAPAFVSEEGRSASCRLPLIYVGRFRVADVQGPNATLVPLEDVTPALVEKINQRDPAPREPTTWALYEKVPADSRLAFQGATQTDLTALATFAMAGRDPARVTAWINGLLIDGKPLPPDQASPTTEVRVRFQKPYKVDVDAAAAEPLPAEPFDSSGRAIASSLVQGQPTEYAEGDETLLDRRTADDLQTKGIVQRLETLSARFLSDYALLFLSMADRRAELADRLTVAQQDFQIIQQASATLDAEQASLGGELVRLAGDRDGLNKELELLDRYLNSLRDQTQQLRQQLTERYQQNILMRQQVASQQGVALN